MNDYEFSKYMGMPAIGFNSRESAFKEAGTREVKVEESIYSYLDTPRVK